tara:strand:- start:508 stop:810 length:303 start_codon:yes stop_codon:yes gene_type:complete
MSERTPDEIRDEAIQDFTLKAYAKFNCGQDEHGGNLDKRVRFRDIEDEIIDLWFYVQSMRTKYESKQVKLKEALAKIDSLQAELEMEQKAAKYYEELSKR